MQFRRDAQRERLRIWFFRFHAAFLAPLPVVGDRVGESLTQLFDVAAREMQDRAGVDYVAVHKARRRRRR